MILFKRHPTRTHERLVAFLSATAGMENAGRGMRVSVELTPVLTFPSDAEHRYRMEMTPAEARTLAAGLTAYADQIEQKEEQPK